MSNSPLNKSQLVDAVEELLLATNHSVKKSVEINGREIDIVAEERQGLAPKTILIECADYSKPVGVDKLQEDIRKLDAARDNLNKYRTVCMHVSNVGYSRQANTYAHQNGLDIFSIHQLQNRIINFESYFEVIERDKQRNVIELEYQETKINPENERKNKTPALKFISEWLNSKDRWLTILGDYGVGKSWLLKKLLYTKIEDYKNDSFQNPIPFFIPLQNFTKAFDFQNLVNRTLEDYGLHGVSYASFQYLSQKGRILYLLDSFDEMAQSLSAITLKNNLKELLTCIGSGSKAIMTSRPTYFESRAERLLVTKYEGKDVWHPIDHEIYAQDTAITREIREKLSRVQFVRLNDLTNAQRKSLFHVVLKDNQKALKNLNDLFDKHVNLESLSQRAVIARMLTVVATYLSSDKNDRESIVSTIIDESKEFNQSVIFNIIILTLLERDVNIGDLSAADRHEFLKRIAILLQGANHSFFAKPSEVKKIVEELFKPRISSSDSYQALMESYYRTCRRHSGLTTEKQFYDTSGNIDAQIDNDDWDSFVGFSHNSLREYLCAESLFDFIVNCKPRNNLFDISITDTICSFIYEMNINNDKIENELRHIYADTSDHRIKFICLKIILYFIGRQAKYISLLGSPITFKDIDISLYDLSALDLNGGVFHGCILLDTDLRGSNLTGAKFTDCSLQNVALDGAVLEKCDFSTSEIISLFVYDKFDTDTTSIISELKARQWLFHHGAIIGSLDGINILLSNRWYIAAQEVAKTLKRRHSGSFVEDGLFKGTDLKYREFAVQFVSFLKKQNILIAIKKSKRSSYDIVKLNSEYRNQIFDFVEKGTLFPELEAFFKKYVENF